jgi:hypothetical protein
VTGPTAPSGPADTITVEFPAAEGYRSVGRLVLGGLASRFELPLDRVDELLLAVDSLLLHGVSGDTVVLVVEARPDELQVRVGPIDGPGLSDPAVARVVTRLVDATSELGASDDGGTYVELVSSARHRRDG